MFNFLKKILKKTACDQTGATAIEYGLIVGLVAAIIITVIGLFGEGLTDLFTDIKTTLMNTIDLDN